MVIVLRGHMVVKALEDANESNRTGTCEETIMVEQGETNETDKVRGGPQSAKGAQ